MNKPTFLLVIVMAVLASAKVQAQSTPLAAAKAFYAYDRAHPQVFNRRNIEARKRWFDAALYRLFLKELDREREFLKQNPTDKPYFGDGLPFQPTDELCEARGRKYRRQVQFGTVTVKEGSGNVDVIFVYPKACKIIPVLYTLHLTKAKGRWLIEDVLYPGSKTLLEVLGRREY
jgi:hypothetical protein